MAMQAWTTVSTAFSPTMVRTISIKGWAVGPVEVVGADGLGYHVIGEFRAAAPGLRHGGARCGT